MNTLKAEKYRSKVSLVGSDHVPLLGYEHEYVVTDGAWTERLHNEDSHEAFCRVMAFVLDMVAIGQPMYNGNGCYHFTAIDYELGQGGVQHEHIRTIRTTPQC